MLSCHPAVPIIIYGYPCIPLYPYSDRRTYRYRRIFMSGYMAIRISGGISSFPSASVTGWIRIFWINIEHNDNCRKLIGTDYADITVRRYDNCLKYLMELVKRDYKVDDMGLNLIIGKGEEAV